MSAHGVEPPEVLSFADKAVDGRYAVTGPDGQAVAWITVVGWGRSRFEAVDVSGALLCSGGRAGMFAPGWRASDATGADFVRLRPGMLGPVRVDLADGRALTARGRMFSRDWRVLAGDEPVLFAESQGGFLHPDAFTVHVYDAALSLAEVVAVVQLNRLHIKAARRARSAAT